MKNQLLFCVLIVMLSFSYSCSPVVYSTNGQVVPLFHERGEATVSGGFSTTDDAEGFHVQAAGSVSDHWALLSSVYSLKSKSSDNWKGHGTYVEFGGGRFGSFGKNNMFIYETFAGVGYAGIRNSYQNSTLDVNFIKPFIQPSIGISQKWVDVALTPRFGLVSYTDHTISTTDAN